MGLARPLRLISLQDLWPPSARSCLSCALCSPPTRIRLRRPAPLPQSRRRSRLWEIRGRLHRNDEKGHAQCQAPSAVETALGAREIDLSKVNKDLLGPTKEHIRALTALRAKQVDKVDTDDVLRLLKPIWLLKNETAKRIRSRVENVLDAAKAASKRSGEKPRTLRVTLTSFSHPKGACTGHTRRCLMKMSRSS